MFTLSLGNCIELERAPPSQAVSTLEFGPLSQPITAHVVIMRNNLQSLGAPITVNFSRRQSLDLATTLHLAQGVACLEVVDTVRRWAVFKICGC